MFNNKKIEILEAKIVTLESAVSRLQNAVFEYPTTATEVFLGFKSDRPRTDIMACQIESLGNQLDMMRKFIEQQGYKWEEKEVKHWVKKEKK